LMAMERKLVTRILKRGGNMMAGGGQKHSKGKVPKKRRGLDAEEGKSGHGDVRGVVKGEDAHKRTLERDRNTACMVKLKKRRRSRNGNPKTK